MSPTQAEALKRMAAGSGRLIRIRGGYWTTPETPTRPQLGPSGHMIPAWSVSVATVYAMEKAGLIERAGEFPEMWRDTRRLPTTATQGDTTK